MRSHHPLRIKAYKEIARARNNVILEPVTNFRCVDCEMGAQLRVMIQAEIKNKIKEV